MPTDFDRRHGSRTLPIIDDRAARAARARFWKLKEEQAAEGAAYLAALDARQQGESL